MTHEDIKKELSAFSEGLLAPAMARIVDEHLLGCGECRQTVRELKSLSSGIKAAFPPAAPEELKQRVLEKAGVKKTAPSRLAPVLVTALAVLILALVSGLVVKRFMPAMFAQIQGMINGAAGQLGDGK